MLLCLPLACSAAEGRCPRLNAGTANGVLGGSVRTTVTPASCEFVRQSGGTETTLRIEVTAAGAANARCGAAREPLKGIGNEAFACTYEGKTGWTGEQVVGRVRGQSFLVRIATNEHGASATSLREKSRAVAEQVAGILF